MTKALWWLTKHLSQGIVGAFASRQKRIKGWYQFWHEYYKFNQLMRQDNRFQIEINPRVGENTPYTTIEPIYFYQDAWAFEKIVAQAPKYHIDIGSHHKFVALLSKVVPVTMVDIRPFNLQLDSLKFQKGSLLELPYVNNSLSSVSSLCVLEHIGLGRYGNPLDLYGSEKAVKELVRVVKPEGFLYISVPIGERNIVKFNAHRVFSEEYLLELLAKFVVVEKKYIYDNEFLDHKKSGFGVACYQFQKKQ